VQRSIRSTCAAAWLLASCAKLPAETGEPRTLPEVAASQLRPVQAFAVFADRTERSQALFLELSRVLFHPRCLNCHPAGDSPLQGMDAVAHDPPVTRGAEDRGVVGMECAGCHQEHNLEHARVPGAPEWHLAPREMAWQGKSPREVCEQLKDPARNGGKDLAAIIEHNAHDELVAWGWKPGSGREPAPGSQAELGALTRAWVESGAACPDEEARP
jgi:hypothetical protein